MRRGGCPTRPVGGLSLKRFLVFVSQLIATAIVTWFIANQAGLSLAALRSLDVSSWRPSAVRVAVSCVALFGGYVASGWLWGLIVRGLGGPRLPGAVSVRLFMVANLGRYVPGKVWQIASLVALGRARGVSAGTATAAAVLGQGIGLGSATLLGLGALWPMADGAAWRWLLPLTLLAAPAVGLTPPVFRALSTSWFRLARTDVPSKLRPSMAAGWLVAGLATWIVYAGAFWLFVGGLGLEVRLVPTASAFAAAYVLGYVIIFAPAGIGVREGFLVAMLAPQVGVAAAGTVAVAARLWTTLIEVVPAAVFWTRHVAETHGASAPHD